MRELERPMGGNHKVTQPCWDPSPCSVIQPRREAQEEPPGTETWKTGLLLLRELFVIFTGWEQSHSPQWWWLLHAVAISEHFGLVGLPKAQE